MGSVSNPLGGPEFWSAGFIFLADGSPGSDFVAQKAGSTLGQVLAQRELRFRVPPGRLLVAPRLLAAPGGFRRLLAAARVRLPGKGGEAAGAENEQLYKERLTET